jgi:hypothetical protein
MTTVKKGDSVQQGQQIGAIGAALARDLAALATRLPGFVA